MSDRIGSTPADHGGSPRHTPYTKPDPPTRIAEYVQLARGVLDGKTVRAADKVNAEALARGVLRLTEVLDDRGEDR